MNFDGHDDDRAGKQKQCSAENLPIFLASFVKVSIFLIILSRHHLLSRLAALHNEAKDFIKSHLDFHAFIIRGSSQTTLTKQR